MPGKMARSAPRPTVGLPKVPIAVCTLRRSCRKGRKSANIHARSAVIRGIPVKVTEHYLASGYLTFEEQQAAMSAGHVA